MGGATRWEEPTRGRGLRMGGACVWEGPACGWSLELNLILGSVLGLLTTGDALITQIQVRWP